MTVMDDSNAGGAVGCEIVMYPGQVTPASYFSGDWAWTVSFDEGFRVADAAITMVRRNDNRGWRFGYGGRNDGDYYISTKAYGQPRCLIFRPSNYTVSAGDVFDVQIEGVTRGGNPHLVQYTVQFIGG